STVAATTASAAPAAACMGWEKFLFALKSLAFGGFALGACGFASSTLFPSDEAMAAQDAAWMQQIHQEAQYEDYYHHRRPYIDPNLLAINDQTDPDVAACMAEESGNVPQKLTWDPLADPAKLKSMYKTNTYLHAQPEDLTAIVIFYEIEKM